MNLYSPPALFGPDRESELLVGYLGTSPGTFIDVGANHPTISSQSWDLEQHGWRGLLVEPLPDMAAQLRQMRQSPVEQVACGAPVDAGRELELMVAGQHSTLNAVTVTGNSEVDSCLVRVETLDQLIDRHGLRQIDFVSIDVEGYEKEVLKGFTIARHRPRLLLVEDHARDTSLHRMISSMSGYRLVRRTGLNSWYVPDGSLFPISLLGRWQLLRKYYLGVPVRAFRHRLRSRRLC